MKNTMGVALLAGFYRSAVRKELKKRGFPRETCRLVAAEYRAIRGRARDIGPSKLLSAYVMGMYFIALNRADGKTPEENYAIFRDGLMASKLFRKVMGDADAYLDPKKMPGRLAWAEASHTRKYADDWVVDVLPGNADYALGYDYTECGIVKLCRAEGCPELAKWLCKLDYVLAEMMGLELKRTGTLAEGAACCDFRYSKKS